MPDAPGRAGRPARTAGRGCGHHGTLHTGTFDRICLRLHGAADASARAQASTDWLRFCPGKGREGNATRLTEIGSELGYSVEVVPALSDESGVISSTEIRKLIEVGNVAEAAHLLGHFYSLHGPVIHGDARGRTINVPTANIAYLPEKMIPAKGIYACWAHLNGQKHPAAINIGTNPTFTPDKDTPNVEAHLLDFRREIYGEDMRLEFVARLRDELKFDLVDVLLEQIWKDVEMTRKILGTV